MANGLMTWSILIEVIFYFLHVQLGYENQLKPTHPILIKKNPITRIKLNPKIKLISLLPLPLSRIK
jgi:hypothetical protein